LDFFINAMFFFTSSFERVSGRKKRTVKSTIKQIIQAAKQGI